MQFESFVFAETRYTGLAVNSRMRFSSNASLFLFIIVLVLVFLGFWNRVTFSLQNPFQNIAKHLGNDLHLALVDMPLDHLVALLAPLGKQFQIVLQKIWVVLLHTLYGLCCFSLVLFNNIFAGNIDKLVGDKGEPVKTLPDLWFSCFPNSWAVGIFAFKVHHSFSQKSPCIETFVIVLCTTLEVEVVSPIIHLIDFFLQQVLSLFLSMRSIIKIGRIVTQFFSKFLISFFKDIAGLTWSFWTIIKRVHRELSFEPQWFKVLTIHWRQVFREEEFWLFDSVVFFVFLGPISSCHQIIIWDYWLLKELWLILSFIIKISS